jgi:hypothetical protein
MTEVDAVGGRIGIKGDATIEVSGEFHRVDPIRRRLVGGHRRSRNACRRCYNGYRRASAAYPARSSHLPISRLMDKPSPDDADLKGRAHGRGKSQGYRKEQTNVVEDFLLRRRGLEQIGIRGASNCDALRLLL